MDKRTMKFTICAIIKNEVMYLEEWIQHCLNIGFDAIHLYEDYGSDSHKDICDKYQNVFLHSYDEVEVSDYNERDKKQIDLFNYFVKTYKSKYDWCAFIDPDEYIRFEDGYSLEKLCSEFPNINGIMIQQKTYGANGHVSRPIGGVQENYSGHPQSYGKNAFNMKTIVNLHGTIEFKGVHRVKGALFTNGFNKLKQNICYKKSWYDHYYTKSWEDWISRFTSRGDVCPGNVQIEYFFNYNDRFTINDTLLEIHVCDHCNLNCKSCSHFSPIAEKKFLTASEIESNLSKIPVNILCSFKEIHLLGGEPLLNDELYEIASVVRKYAKISIIKIVTNGLLVKKKIDYLKKICNDFDIILAMTRYPIKLDYFELERIIKENDIKYECYNGEDFEDKFIKMPLNISGSCGEQNSFAKCKNAQLWHCAQLIGTKLYVCPVMAYSYIFENKFGVKFNDNEYLDLSSCSLDDIETYLSESKKFCKYCDVSSQCEIDWGISKKEIDEWI